ncbi:MAG: NADH:flavin oxidoreductase [Eubacteriales bacterium]|nr:NADH:flavin oxidoreductase [Eubacteriales bacterium]
MGMITEQVKIGNLELNGRIIMPPMGTYKCDASGFVTDEVIDYYRERAKNPHIGLIITEHTYISKKGKAKANQMSIAEDDKLPGLKRLVDAIHAEGTPVFAQLNFAGSASPSEVTGSRALAPSAVVLPTTPRMGDETAPKEMTEEEISEVITAFVAAARRAKNAGYDGIEIHSAHAYLLNQFYSPLTNHRTDAYGGTLENRLRIHREVLRAVRAEVGADYPISVRLGGYDDMDGGNTLEDAVKAAKIIAAEGIELLSLTGGMCRYLRKGHSEPGYFGDMSAAVRKEVSVPVLLTGGVKTLDDAEKLIAEDIADFIGVGRPLLSKADWMMQPESVL